MKLNHAQTIATTHFSRTEANQALILYEGDLSVEYSGNVGTYVGTVEFSWLRAPALEVSFTQFGQSGPREIYLDEITVSFPGCLRPLPVQITSYRGRADADGKRREYRGSVNAELFVGQDDPVHFVLLHLANFHDTTGGPLSGVTEGYGWAGRFVLNSEQWRVTIDKVEHHESVFEVLSNVGGYGITHVLKIDRNNGAEFKWSDISRIREQLFYFLSFVRGHWTEPFSEIGCDKSSRVVYERWSIPRTDPWRVGRPWFDPTQPKVLDYFWQEFRMRLDDATWSDVLKRAIFWYISTNKQEGGADGSIILAQAVYELLSWTHFTTIKGLSANGFEKLPAADKLRLLLLEADIQLSIPTSLAGLAALAQSENWNDGPSSITELRNSLVHHKPQNRARMERVEAEHISQAYMLTMSYLDLLLLYFLGYRGEYMNRLRVDAWMGETDIVPWSEKSVG